MRSIFVFLIFFCFFSFSFSKIRRIKLHRLSDEGFNYINHGKDWEIGVCQSGFEQSPIDILPSLSIKCDGTQKLTINWQNDVTSKVINEIETLKSFGLWSTLDSNDVDGNNLQFTALQFHFHSPSEHTINGVHYDLETHIVHKLTDNSTGGRYLAVLGLLFQVEDTLTTPNPFLEAYSAIPDSELVLNLHTLLEPTLGQNPDFFAYKGSLTTPPCTEAVNWYVVSTPIPIQRSQLEKFTNFWSGNPSFADGQGNNRAVQPLNSRVIKLTESCQ